MNPALHNETSRCSLQEWLESPQHTVLTCSNSLEHTIANASTTAGASNEAMNCTTPNIPTTFQPRESTCIDMPNPYTAEIPSYSPLNPAAPSAPRKFNFTIHCNSDLPPIDLLILYMYTFEDCIAACADWGFHNNTHPNSSCIGVSYTTNVGWVQSRKTCFLKGGTRTKPTPMKQVDVALRLGP